MSEELRTHTPAPISQVLIKKRAVLERNRDDVLKGVMAGLSDTAIAYKYDVGAPAIAGFRRRYAVTIAQMMGEVEAQVAQYVIASKVNRIAAKDRRWQLLESVRQEKAKGRTGEETGLVNKTYKMLGSGPEAAVVAEYKVDTDLIRMMEATERGAAEELGQLPKAGDQYVFAGTNQQINIFDRGQAVNLARALTQLAEGAVDAINTDTGVDEDN